MKPYLAILITLLSFLLFSTCKDDKGKSPEVKKLYETSQPITPLDEYKKGKSREWENLEKDHLPQIIINENKKKNITVRVSFSKEQPGHYIEKIGIMDSKKRDIVPVKSLTNKGRIFEASFSLSPIPENAKVYVKCNLHDLWTKKLKSGKD